MLAIAIDYLTGRSVSTVHNDRDAAEWPPHPARLFFALVNAWAEGGKDDEEQQALEWLEQQLPPFLHVSEADDRPPRTTYVPPNDPKATDVRILPDRRRRQQRTFPSVTPREPIMYMAWPEARPTPIVRASLQRIAARVSYLGHSSSLVSLRLTNEAPEPTLAPTDSSDGELVLRVPAVGQLAALEHAYAVYIDPNSGVRGQLPCAFQAYGRRRSVSEPAVAAGVFGEMVVFRRRSGPHLPPEAAELVAATLRGAVIRASDEPIPEILSGHARGGSKSERPHVAFSALPDVGHPHADGHLLGVAAVLPASVAEPDRRAAYRALSRVSRLTMGRAGAWDLERITLEAPQRGLLPGTWTRASERWASVTPVELDGFPDEPYGEEAAGIVIQSCVRTGLPEPMRVVVGPDSIVPGAPPWHAFAKSRQRTSRPRRPVVHVVIDFPCEVQGPVLLGAGRYQGLGLCRPIRVP